MNSRASIRRAVGLAGAAFVVWAGFASRALAEKPYRELAQIEGLNVHGLAEDGAFVYVGVRTPLNERATIYKIPKAGGPKVAIYTGPDLPGAMVARPSGVYFTRATEAGGIMVVPISGGKIKRLDQGDTEPTLDVRAAGKGSPELSLRSPYDRLVVDGEQIFVSSSYVNVVGVLPRTGGVVKVLAKPRGARVTGLAASRDRDVVHYTTDDGQMWHAAMRGGSRGRDLDGRDAPHDVIAFEGRLAWAEGKPTGPGRCFLLRDGGAAPVPLPDVWSGIESLATSRDALWFVFADRHQAYHLAKAPLAGGPAVEVPGPFGVDAVVADAKTAYFVALKDAKNKYLGAIGQ